MKKMRDVCIPDSKIGRVFGISRQRVGQILGTHPEVENDPDYEKMSDRIRSLFLGGVACRTIAYDLNIIDRQVYRVCRGIPEKDKRIARQKRKFLRVKARLEEFVSTLDSKQFSTKMLVHYDAGLYQLAIQLMPMDKWAELFGLDHVKNRPDLYGKAAADATEDTYR